MLYTRITIETPGHPVISGVVTEVDVQDGEVEIEVALDEGCYCRVTAVSLKPMRERNPDGSFKEPE